VDGIGRLPALIGKAARRNGDQERDRWPRRMGRADHSGIFDFHASVGNAETGD